jgi:dTMP kinase
MNQGKLIVIEGACDGIGKSTQYQKLIDRLKQEGNKVVSHHFPTYGSYQAMPGEEYLKGNLGKKEDISPYLVNTFFAVDRAITWITKLKKEYENGSIIILDRYTTSSTLYQSSLIDDLDERKKFIDYIIDYEWNKLGIKKPDKVIFLNADFEAVQNMLKLRGDNGGVENDIYEADMTFMKNVHDNAVSVAKYLNWDIIECSKDGKMLSIDEIHDKIYDVFKNN